MSENEKQEAGQVGVKKRTSRRSGTKAAKASEKTSSLARGSFLRTPLRKLCQSQKPSKRNSPVTQERLTNWSKP